MSQILGRDGADTRASRIFQICCPIRTPICIIGVGSDPPDRPGTGRIPQPGRCLDDEKAAPVESQMNFIVPTHWIGSGGGGTGACLGVNYSVT